jgi:hypothetical protein
MNQPEFLAEYVWQSGEFPLCTVCVPVAQLAERFGISLVHWEEPGLGSATGFGCRLASGLVLLLEELAHARKHLGTAGPTIYVEAVEVVERGIQATLVSTLAGLRLSPQSVIWSQPESGLRSAQSIVEAASERKRRHNGA